MPTGYTAKLCDGKQSFEDFAMNCARAFGALVTMRDEPANAAIPREFKPSDYHSKAIKEAKTRLAKFKAMSLAKAEGEAMLEFADAVAAWHKRRRENVALRDRLGDMRRDVSAWAPPTPDHAGLKAFMLEQLDRTAEFDGVDFGEKPKLATGLDYRNAGIEKAIGDIAYHNSEHEKEVERCRQRTGWVQALRDSLKAPAAK